MNKRILSLILSVLLLLTCAACTKQASPDADAPTVERLTDADGASVPPYETQLRDDGVAVITETNEDGEIVQVPVQEVSPPGARPAADGRLLIRDYGPYSGSIYENGSVTQVENVAAILVENISGQTCTYCEMTFLVDEQDAVFTVEELPAGRAVWVIEQNHLPAADNSVFAFDDDVCEFRASDGLEGFSWQASKDSVTLTNQTGSTQTDLTVCCRLADGDGVYLGGICCRVKAGTLASGASVTLPVSDGGGKTWEVTAILHG